MTNLDQHIELDMHQKTGRVCGDCRLCCKLLPVRALDKGANTRCQHQRVGKGCMVYGSDAMPFECKIWSCRWLVDKDAAIPRPDRSHYVVDIMPDSIGVVQDDQEHEVMVVQVWVDPAFPDAYRDPALRAYLAMLGERDQTPTIVRFANARAILMVPPAMTSSGKWLEREITLDDKHANRFLSALAGQKT